MQRIIRRTQMAERQAARVLARKKEKYRFEKAKSDREQAQVLRREEGELLRNARKARKEDWELGPLAPKRDVGDAKRTYGALSAHLQDGSKLRDREVSQMLNRLGWVMFNIVEGDRVVLLHGRDKGKIGKVIEVNKESAQVKVDGLNMADYAVPKWLHDLHENEESPVQPRERGIPIDKVRLICRLTNPETGNDRDVIANHLINFRQRNSVTNKKEWVRMIPGEGANGEGLLVEWPEKDPEKEEDEYEIDTLRIDVDKKTFVPTLLRPPMPSTIIDELRNKYSKFRTRHDPQYIVAKTSEDEENIRKRKEAEAMTSPMREINRKLRKLRKMKGKGNLSEKMKEKLGEIMARKRQLKLERAGLGLEEGNEEDIDGEWEDVLDEDSKDKVIA